MYTNTTFDLKNHNKLYSEKSVFLPHREKKIGLPVAFNVSRMIEYATSGAVPFVKQLSSFK
jgi:hypothetical protein